MTVIPMIPTMIAVRSAAFDTVFLKFFESVSFIVFLGAIIDEVPSDIKNNCGGILQASGDLRPQSDLPVQSSSQGPHERFFILGERTCQREIIGRVIRPENSPGER